MGRQGSLDAAIFSPRKYLWYVFCIGLRAWVVFGLLSSAVQRQRSLAEASPLPTLGSKDPRPHNLNRMHSAACFCFPLSASLL